VELTVAIVVDEIAGFFRGLSRRAILDSAASTLSLAGALATVRAHPLIHESVAVFVDAPVTNFDRAGVSRRRVGVTVPLSVAVPGVRQATNHRVSRLPLLVGVVAVAVCIRKEFHWGCVFVDF